jgi:methylated-DNA-protein-cysteine methyltransferase related protein
LTEKEYRDLICGFVARIPPGKVATFGMLAALAGNPAAARRAARAVANAPGGLPCHRVVKAGGKLVPGYVFGYGEQRAALIAEGVMFRDNGSVRLDDHIWKPSEEMERT